MDIDSFDVYVGDRRESDTRDGNSGAPAEQAGRVIVPYPAGGNSDPIGRFIADT